MHDLGGGGAEDVHPEDATIVGRDEQLEEAVRVADDLAACELAVPSEPDLVRDLLVCELALGPPDEADLGDRVDAYRVQLVEPVRRLAARVVRRSPPLLHRRGRQGGEPMMSPTA